MFSKEIDRDIASQRSDLQRQQQLLGMQGQQLGAEGAAIDDDFWDSVKIARMHAVSEQAQAQLAQLDPRGTAAINGAALVREQQARTAQAEAALMDKQLKQSQGAAEFDLKRRKQEMDERNVASQIAEREAKMRPKGGGGKPAGTVTETAANAGAKIEDLATKLGITDPRDRNRLVLVNPAQVEGGIATNEKMADALNTRLPAARQFISIASRLRNSIKEHGWEPSSSRWSSGPGETMLADYGALKLLVKDMEELGAITEADAGLIEGLIGGDPTEARVGEGGLALLDRSMDNAEGRINGLLRQAGISVEFKPARPGAVKVSAPSIADRIEAAENLLKEGNPDPKAARALLAEIAALGDDRSTLGPFRDRIGKLADTAARKLSKQDRTYRVGGSAGDIGAPSDVAADLALLSRGGTEEERTEAKETATEAKKAEERRERERVTESRRVQSRQRQK
jgi:hypothetical protein